jgi:hypothetical protein
MAVLAISSTASYVGGPPRPFEQRPVSADERRAIESLTQELLALDREARRARIAQLIGPEAPAEAPDALAAQFDTLKEATDCSLAAVDAYGPKLIKAIYTVTDRDGRASQVALSFERSGRGLALLEVAH